MIHGIGSLLFIEEEHKNWKYAGGKHMIFSQKRYVYVIVVIQIEKKNSVVGPKENFAI
jgi:hypothetical protein